MFGFRRRPAALGQPDDGEAADARGNVQVVRTVTMPNGKKLRVMRKDAFDRAIVSKRSAQPA